MIKLISKLYYKLFKPNPFKTMKYHDDMYKEYNRVKKLIKQSAKAKYN